MLPKIIETDIDVAYKSLNIKVSSMYIEHLRNGIIFENNGELYKLELKKVKRKEKL